MRQRAGEEPGNEANLCLQTQLHMQVEKHHTNTITIACYQAISHTNTEYHVVANQFCLVAQGHSPSTPKPEERPSGEPHGGCKHGHPTH